MYTILVNNDNELITTVRERIMQRSKLVDSLHFLVDPIYKDIEMKDFTVRMDYMLPISQEPHSEILNLSINEDGSPLLYKEHLEYKIPINSNLTHEHGDIELRLTFTKTELDTDGTTIQHVRKTSSTTITIIPISAWCIPSDSALDAIDQRQLKADELIKAVAELGELLVMTKADNLVLNDTSLQLTANGEPIGDEVKLETLSKSIVENTKEGTVKVVQF